MAIPEKGRQSAHVLIDAVSVASFGGADAVELALQRLLDIGAIEVTLGEDADGATADINLSDLLGGTMMVENWLIGQLAESRGLSRDDVIEEVRQYIDSI